MNKFIAQYIVKPLAVNWLRGFFLLLLWTVSFVALPAISGWFLAMCSIVFVTASTTFSYLVPSAIIRLMALVRTAMRYFERLENHKTTLKAQQSLQLKLFQSVARLPYFKKQVNNNSSLLENGTHGVDQILNHILLWLLPLSALICTLCIYAFFLAFYSDGLMMEFLISSAVLLFIVPQFFFAKNRKLYEALKISREENNQALIQSFRGRIEISKYELEDKAIEQYEQKRNELEQLEQKLQTNSFWLQSLAGLGFSYIAALLLWRSGHYNIDAPTAIGIFFGIMAQAELAEMLFSGKSEKSAVAHQIKDIGSVIKQGDASIETVHVATDFSTLNLTNFSAKVPETNVETEALSFDIRKGDWIALYGETGKGKSTLLNSLFYPEYRRTGTMTWNKDTDIECLPVPTCIYVTQKAYLLTGTLRENFEGYPDEAIESALRLVDLESWRSALPEGLDTWIGENGETLSGGQRKKLLLAQALLKRPQLLVVDEPTAGISSENAIAIFKNIKQHYPDITLLMATHLKDFEKAVDKVIRI